MEQGLVTGIVLIGSFIAGYFVGRKHGKKYNELIEKLEEFKSKIK